MSSAIAPGERMPILKQYVRMALRWRYVILGSIAACVILGLIITLLMTPKFTATTTIEIARESSQITNIQAVEREAGAADQEFYQTAYGLLKARSLAERVATNMRLVDDPKFFEMFDAIGKTQAFQLTNGRFPATGRKERIGAAAGILLKNIKVSPVRLSRLVEVSFTSPDPELSAKIVNAWSSNYIQLTLERRYQATSYARTFLERRLNQIRERLEVSERQLVAYASSQRIINVPSQVQDGQRTSERAIVVDDLTALNTALTQATADRIDAQSHYQAGGGSGGNAEALRNTAINSLRQKRAELSSDYQRLMTQFEPGYPSALAIKSQLNELDRSIVREESRVGSSIQNTYRQAVEKERELKARVDQLKNDVLDSRRRSIQYNIFQRDVDTNRQLYDGLLQRYKEIGAAAGVGVNNVSIIDAANPPNRPSSPRFLVNLALSIILGGLIGLGLAFALEQIDEAVVDPDELSKELGLPLLGSVPKLRSGDIPEALRDRKSEVVDAYLAIQANLRFSTDHGIPRSIAVTSTRPGEGKSSTSLAVATLLARVNRTVLLVDGDMRSPSIHHLSNVDNAHGLSNFLTGSDNFEALIRPMPNETFSVLTSGPIPPNAAELLTGERLNLLLERLGEQFDHIVIDCPPVLGLADAPLIASRVEGTIYVVESHGTRTSVVRTALGRLASSNARILGGILTKFDARRSHLGYGYDYSYSYGDRGKDTEG
jgi:succinoglycan biosynthesis transport protein ExoP